MNKRKMRLWTKFEVGTAKIKKAEILELLARVRTLVEEVETGGSYQDVEVYDALEADGRTLATYRADTGQRLGTRAATPEERTGDLFS